MLIHSFTFRISFIKTIVWVLSGASTTSVFSVLLAGAPYLYFRLECNRMHELMKIMNLFDFKYQTPLTELQIPMNSVFPTILAIFENRLNENMREAICKNKQTSEETKEYISKPEKTSKQFGKSDKQNTKSETNTYALIYYNPESKKAELIEGSVSLNYEDTTQQAIEEGLAQRSTYGMYSLIATQMIRENVDEQLMREIMARIKIEHPDPFGGGVARQVNYKGLNQKILEEYRDKIIAFEVSEKKKTELEEKIAVHIKLVDEIIIKMESQNSDVCELISKLPPLSKERMFTLFRKKKISKAQIITLLLKDNQFLKAVKEKINSMSVQDILHVVLNLKK